MSSSSSSSPSSSFRTTTRCSTLRLRSRSSRLDDLGFDDLVCRCLCFLERRRSSSESDEESEEEGESRRRRDLDDLCFFEEDFLPEGETAL